MKRGRELRAKGMSGDEIRNIQLQEFEDGTLSLPEKPMQLYSLTGGSDGRDYTTHTL